MQVPELNLINYNKILTLYSPPYQVSIPETVCFSSYKAKRVKHCEALHSEAPTFVSYTDVYAA